MNEPCEPKLINGEYHIYECPITTKSHLPVQEDAETDTTKTILQNVRATMKRYPNEPYLGHRAGLATCVKEISDTYTYMTYGEADSYLTELAKVLTKLGIGKRDRVGIFARNSPLWLLFDFACTAVGAVVVPIYDTLGAAKTSYCINHAEVRLLITQTELLPLVLGIWPSCPGMQQVLIIDATISELDEQTINACLHKAIPSYIEAQQSDGSSLGIDLSKLYVGGRGDDSVYKFNVLSTVASQLGALSDTTDVRMANANINDSNDHIAEIINEISEKTQIKGPSSKVSLLKHMLNEVKDLEYKGDYEADVNEIHTILYTSGSSGNPKGVTHTHSTIQGSYTMAYAFLPYASRDGEQMVAMSYLPLGHIYESAGEMLFTVRGYKIAYYSGNTKNLTTDIKLAKPTILLAVPRVLQKIYNAVMTKVEASLVKKVVFRLACKVKEYTEDSWIKTGTLPWLDNIVFKDIKAALGGHLELIVSGSSALPQEVWRFMRLCTGARITCGYGLTETCLVGLRVLPHDPIKYSPAGKLVSFMQAKLIDKSDSCELSLKTHRVGELLLKGPGVAKEYYKMPENPLQDEEGYFHTGDLMRLNDDGSLTFVRRINMVVKSLMGEFIDICAVEDAMERSPLFISVFLHAQSDKSFPICVAVLDKTALAHRLKCSADDVEKADHVTAIKSVLNNEANIFVKRAGLKGYCVPKCFRWFFDVDWSTDQELMTPSLKKQHRFFDETLCCRDCEHVGGAPVV
ncbi:Long chain fatty acid CoA ligase 5 [Giardia duodenalis ATCC 50581]|uniref:Long chain fatty acid CoA ligase 5 n=1 Tax=Giardia intestinalis (strain ATCC 50581 / GS clone H7) TaxID=598745 RepID=C6LTK8_GIAIB|nr:Long chain fatty acid CoA ligase 5 [Giardia intestinalis ATCC 50581]